MPTAKTPKPVPKLSKQTICIAHCAAVELWEGRDYETGKEIIRSDEEFLSYYSSVTFGLLKNKKPTAYSRNEIHNLIVQAKLKALYRSTLPTDIPQAIKSYKSVPFKNYKDWKAGKLKLSSSYECGTKAALDWSPKFVNSVAPSLNGNHRVALSNRILFYAMPDIEIYNFSNGLCSKLNLQTRPQAALPHYNKMMHEGFVRNQLLLNILIAPKGTFINKNHYKKCLAADWWKRRVFDLALLIHFGIAKTTPEVRRKGRALVKSLPVA
jgi:hypothetical protein